MVVFSTVPLLFLVDICSGQPFFVTRHAIIVIPHAEILVHFSDSSCFLGMFSCRRNYLLSRKHAPSGKCLLCRYIGLRSSAFFIF